MANIEKGGLPVDVTPPEVLTIREQFEEAFRSDGRVLGTIDVSLCVARGFTEKVASLGARIVKKLV